MRRIACALLGLWAGINFLLGVGILFAMLVLKQNAPGLGILYSSSEIPLIDSRALATINGLAVFANACAAAYSAVALVLLWRSLKHNERWAFRVLWASSLPLQAMGFASDTYFARRDLVANAVSASLLVLGLIAVNMAMRHHEQSKRCIPPTLKVV